ncbi:MAG TPA: 2'-deoxycytidine 5'-triphosphate deaminase [Candidatus Nanoarchaeia archaeon]|nr:2'-deoxycytidine 5'-triphosphate deaminase [Candidatus Nanoarchaeia archaeon]
MTRRGRILRAAPSVQRPSLEGTVGRCWASQEIRQAIHDGQIIVPEFSEARIQPSSFEPTIGDEAFLLDTEGGGIFSPARDKSIYHSLLEIPNRRRQRIDLQKNPVLRNGFSYLIPLRERLAFTEPVFLRASPKSSIGRVFTHVRALTDYVPTLDEAFLSSDQPRSPLQSWLLVQPLKFDVVVVPGLSLHQLRIFTGHGARLDALELYKELQHRPLLYVRNTEGELCPVAHEIRETGIALHLDLRGKNTSGIVALRARPNATPIDLTQSAKHNPEDYFEPLKSANGTLTIRPGSYYLLASREVFSVPPNRNVELGVHSDASFRGPRHFAGFVDNGFTGDLVLELRIDEPTLVDLRDGDPIGELHVFRTAVPDKLYGADIKSNYQSQEGPRIAKYFTPFDHALSARDFSKLERQVMTYDSRALRQLLPNVQGFTFLEERQGTNLLSTLGKHLLWHSRYDCENDELLRQPIPYLVLFGSDGKTVFSYQRALDRKDYGETRLQSRHSLGIGGHVIPSDGPDYFGSCLQRELQEELNITGTISEPRLTGVILDDRDAVGRVHLGLVYVARLSPCTQVSPKETALLHGEMNSLAVLAQTTDSTQYEGWSKELIPHLAQLYKRT